MVPLEVVPAEVGAVKSAAAFEVDLLPEALPDVADQDPAVVEREPERVAQAECVDLVSAALADEWVAAGRPVGLRAVLVGVDSQELAQQLVLVLSVLVRVARAAAVARPRVQPPVGSELELPPVVVPLSRVPDHDHPAARALQRPGVGRSAELVDLDVPGPVRVVGVEVVVALVVGIEGDREQASLASGRDPAGDVEEGAALDVAVVDHPDRAALLDHVEEARRAGSVGDVGRRGEAADLVLADPRRARRRSADDGPRRRGSIDLPRTGPPRGSPKRRAPRRPR